ncbi:hypothetical protein C1645_827360 [Glomus cerebriforme]|uniref:Uncharacterized protein n=1 Tax=Glomus cerebriforme TaxID=658196 RepID=A0A397SV00_9GLOM|nr:hypothetical protein C1645_827360 [Glomus cerebriforme]
MELVFSIGIRWNLSSEGSGLLKKIRKPKFQSLPKKLKEVRTSTLIYNLGILQVFKIFGFLDAISNDDSLDVTVSWMISFKK